MGDRDTWTLQGKIVPFPKGRAQAGGVGVGFFPASLILVFPPKFQPHVCLSQQKFDLLRLKLFRRTFNSGLQRWLRNEVDAGSTPKVVTEGYKMGR